jgi:hypothetical protein
LACWQTPDDFNGEVSAFIKPLSRGEFFNVPALAFLRDAWTLGKFASLAGAEAVKLSLDNFPDGHTKLGSEQLDIEITEAIMPDRRRGQEFLPGSPQMEEDPGHEWDRRISALPQVLLSTVRKKAMKAYSAKPTLVVYLNISAYGHRAGECRAAIRATIRAFSASFAGLYVLWGDELFGPM